MSLRPTVRPLSTATNTSTSSTVQGEIAYVLDGNIWLLDLVSGESQPLTDDGNNRWPTWSADGRYLFYTHTPNDDEMALYLIDLDKLAVDQESKPQLLAKDACCATWDHDNASILFISTAGTELTLQRILIDSWRRVETGITLTYGRSSWPAGNLRLYSNNIFLTLEVIDNGAGSELVNYTGLFYRNENGPLQPIDASLQGANCSLGHLDFYHHPNGSTQAGDFVGQEHCGGQFSADQGIWIAEVGITRELPQLAYPSFANDHSYLAAERYVEGDNAITAKPEGVILYNLNDDSQQLLIAGGAQPAWRPAPPIPPAVARYIQPGERVISLEPTLAWQGTTWQIHLLTTTKLTAVTPQRLLNASPEVLQQQGVTTFIVTQDQNVVRDPTQLRQFFLRYNAAYTLYNNPPTDLLPPISDELNKVLNNPIFMAMAAPQLLQSRRSQTTEVLRALLTDATQAQYTLDPLFEQAFVTAPDTMEKALDVLAAAIEHGAAHDADLIRLRPDLAAAYAGLAETAQAEKFQLKLLQLTTQLLFLDQLQAERGKWLQDYLNDFASGAGSFDRDQLRAAVDVLEEVKNNNQQRIDIATSFIEEMSKDIILDKVGEVARAKASEVVAHIAEKFGTQLAANSVAGVLAAGMVGMTAGNLLYGTDELYANFSLAARADELRATFQQGRQILQRQASTTTSYDGDLAERFRIAYLLETLAAIASQRAYADGVAATFQLPNPVQLINWLRGEDWQGAVQELHTLANEMETNLVTTFATPANVDILLTLTAKRVNTQATAPACKESVSKAHPAWTTYTHGNSVQDMLLLGDTLWAATTGGVVCWNTRTGSYNKFTTTAGLAHNDVRSLRQSADGALWFATWGGGVSRLSADGVWTTFTTQDGLADNYVFSLLQSADEALWFGTWDGGVSRLSADGAWTTFTTADGLADNTILSLLQSTDGALWVGTDGGVSRLSVDGAWTTFTTADGLASNEVSSLLQSTDGALWFGTDGGVSRLSVDGVWTTFTTADGLAHNDVRSLQQSADGALWVGTWDGDVSRLGADGNWIAFTTADGLVDSAVLSVLQSADGSLWFGTRDGGVSRLSPDGDWADFTTADGLVDDTVNSLLQSADGALWFGTNGGVSRLSADGDWATFTTKDGLGSNSVNSLLQSVDGTLWFGTWNGGVSRLSVDGTWATFTTASWLPDNDVTSLLQSTDGTLWFGTYGGGVSRLSPDGIWTTFTTADGLADNDVTSLMQSADGALWFGTDGGGMSRLSADSLWATFTTQDGLVDNDVRSLLQSTDGTLWVGTWNGVSRLSLDGGWTTFTIADGLADNNVTNLLQSADGALWFATYGGVSRLSPDSASTTFTTRTDEGTEIIATEQVTATEEITAADENGAMMWTTFTTQNGLADNDVNSLLQSADGALWVATWFGGVSRLSVDSAWTTFTANDGLASNDISNLLQSADGALWFATYGGGVSRLSADGVWTTFTSQDGLASNDVTSLLQSADGALWFGTVSSGVSRYQPSEQ